MFYLFCDSGGWNFIFNRNKKNKEGDDSSRSNNTELKDLYSDEDKHHDGDVFTDYSCDEPEKQSEMSDSNLSEFP